MLKRIVLGAVAAVAMALPASASSVFNPYSSFVVLGDSLSDNGETGAGGVSTDDTVWNQQFMDGFRANGSTAVNLAYGGATATNTRDNPAGIVDLTGQLQDFAEITDPLGDRPLVSLWFGGNDFLQGEYTPQTAIGAAGAVLSAIDTLGAQGVTDFLIFTLPDLGLIPASAGFPPPVQQGATQLSALFNATLLGGLPTQYNISVVDVFTLSQQLDADPASFGVTGPGPCLITGESCAQTAYWDPIHPTSVIHERIAQEALEALAPVPLPAGGVLIVTGLVALGALRRKKRAAA